MIANLNDPDKIIDLLHNLDSAVNRHIDQVLLEQLGVGLTQYRILRLLQSKTAAQRELADGLNQTEAAISRQVKLMQERGWLQTATDPSERRKRHAKLTPAGLKIAMAAQEISSEQCQKFCQNLNSKRQTALLQLLQDMNIYHNSVQD